MPSKAELLKLVAEYEKVFRNIQQQEDILREELKSNLSNLSADVPGLFANTVKDLICISKSRREAWQKAANLWDKIGECE